MHGQKQVQGRQTIRATVLRHAWIGLLFVALEPFLVDYWRWYRDTVGEASQFMALFSLGVGLSGAFHRLHKYYADKIETELVTWKAAFTDDERIRDFTIAANRIVDASNLERDVVNGRTYEYFQRMHQTSPMKAVREAIKYCWLKHDLGRIPVLTKQTYYVTVDAHDSDVNSEADERGVVGDGSNPAGDMDQDSVRTAFARVKEIGAFSELKFLRINFFGNHGFDTNIIDSADGSFFDISNQTPADVIKQVIKPLAVMPTTSYLANAEAIWDKTNFEMTYPVVGRFIDACGAGLSDAQNDGFMRNLHALRAMPWVSGVDLEFINSRIQLENNTAREGLKGVFSDKKISTPICSVLYVPGFRDNHYHRIEYKSVFKNNGTLDRASETWTEFKKHATEAERRAIDLIDLGETDREGQVASRQGIVRPVVGFYIPDFFSEKTREFLDKLQPEHMKEAQIYHFAAYLNIGLAESTRKIGAEPPFSYRQSSYEFPIGKTSTFASIDVQLLKGLFFRSDPAVALYSMQPFGISQRPYGPQKYSYKASGNDEETMLYPNDVFVIRWSEKAPSAQTDGEGARA